ncbi:MAG: DNA repair protein [Bdellovibrio sp. ArHS]|uniref:DUF488 domain-containing protein n=1 Tax=Bdellovibrio sp. ArHS TaxID=1569284 RepID=UPI0005834E81|nr:DUF488 domain-containing protein [Bdellovibrio sp. ArHS]KHD89030.1 MAG: DNA repair protein [Bdellovibrio sp. ArHS]
MKVQKSTKTADKPFFTVGHSTRSLAEFVHLLQAEDIKLVVDVRTVPRSRTNPQYNKDTLPEDLAAFKIGYRHLTELGGLRSKSKVVPTQENGFWQNSSFHNYADYALSEDFLQGLDKLIKLGRKKRCAIMCSEAVWWRCHRRIISDYLLARGETVFHLMGKDRIEPAHLTAGAKIKSERKIVYPLSKVA